MDLLLVSVAIIADKSVLFNKDKQLIPVLINGFNREKVIAISYFKRFKQNEYLFLMNILLNAKCFIKVIIYSIYAQIRS
jgi:hypothetical protein